MGTDKQALRRRVLELYVKSECGGNVSEFARRAGKAQSQVADMLAGRKPFGEKIARELETKLLLGDGYFDVDPSAPKRQHEVMIFGAPITAEAAAHGREWARLSEPFRSLIATLVSTILAAQIRDSRRVKQPKAPKRRDSAHTAHQ